MKMNLKEQPDEDGERTSVFLTPQSYYPTGGGLLMPRYATENLQKEYLIDLD